MSTDEKDFTSLVSDVAAWLQNCETEFDFQKIESERKFSFTVKGTSLSFYIQCPEERKKWTICSTTESSEIIEGIQSVQDYCESSREKTITDVLNRFYPFLQRQIECRQQDLEDEDEDDGDDECYYMDPDEDAAVEEIPEKDEMDEAAENFFGGIGSPAATQRLLKDLKNMQSARQFGIDGTPRGDNLFVWDVKLTDLPNDTRLGKDLEQFAKNHKREPVVYLEMQFPPDYPMSPPFVRVIRPRFQFLTGHVTIGGSICMEMLTRSGWRPTNDIESILVQIRSEIMSDPNARLDANSDRQYTEGEARDAFDRMVNRYGWNK